MINAELFYLLTLVNSLALLGCLYELVVYRRRRRRELYTVYEMACTDGAHDVSRLSQEAFNDALERIH